MTTTNITNFRKNAFDYVEQTIKYNQPVNITTKDGNAVLLSEEDYSGIMETLYLVSAPTITTSYIMFPPIKYSFINNRMHALRAFYCHKKRLTT